jgi:hypothetical protein
MFQHGGNGRRVFENSGGPLAIIVMIVKTASCQRLNPRKLFSLPETLLI